LFLEHLPSILHGVLAWGGIGSVGWGFIVPMCDETLPIINKPKTPKKGGIQGTKRKDPRPRRQKNNLRERTTKRTSSFQTPSYHNKHIK
jgi:hypothetical protein